MSRTLLQRIGQRIRRHRGDRGLTIKDLSGLSGLSPRYLSDVEAGKGNISVGRLAAVAEALEVSTHSLVRYRSCGLRRQIDTLLDGCNETELERLLSLLETARGRRSPAVIALLGVRGAGKSTVGARLSEALGLPFVELVLRVEERAGMALSDIFTLHGESYYRRLELQCLNDVLATASPCVVAMPGGIVGNGNALEMICSTCRSVWLKARPEDYWARVFAQGDRRPMAGRQDAMADLEELVRRREPLYRRADCTVDTADRTVDEVLSSVLAELEVISHG